MSNDDPFDFSFLPFHGLSISEIGDKVKELQVKEAKVLRDNPSSG